MVNQETRRPLFSPALTIVQICCCEWVYFLIIASPLLCCPSCCSPASKLVDGHLDCNNPLSVLSRPSPLSLPLPSVPLPIPPILLRRPPTSAFRPRVRNRDWQETIGARFNAAARWIAYCPPEEVLWPRVCCLDLLSKNQRETGGCPRVRQSCPGSQLSSVVAYPGSEATPSDQRITSCRVLPPLPCSRCHHIGVERERLRLFRYVLDVWGLFSWYGSCHSPRQKER